MQLAVWVGTCLAASFLLRSHVRVLLAAVLVLWLLVPAVGSGLITGLTSGPLSIHAASWLVFSIAVTRLLSDPGSLQLALARHFLLFLILGIVFVAAFVSSVAAANGGMVPLVDQIAAPILYFLLLLSAAVRFDGMVALFRTLLLVLVAVLCVIAVAQWHSGQVLFYRSGFLTQYWFGRDSGRWMATLDQPLAFSLVLSVAAPLVAGLRRLWLQAGLLGMMAVGVLISQSRVGLVAVAVAAVVTLALGRTRPAVKTGMFLVMAAGAAAIVTSPLFAGVAGRLADDTGSGQARGLALEYFLERWAEYAVVGEGIGSSYRVAVQAGLETSFENPILMYSIDFGIVFAAFYFGAMGLLVLRKLGAGNYPGLALAGFMAVVIPQTYSSLATRSAAGILIWTVLAMVVIATDEARFRAVAARAEGTRARADSEADPALPAGRRELARGRGGG